MEIAFVLGIIIGLPICFYGLYIYKIYLAITTFIGALVTGIILIIYSTYGNILTFVFLSGITESDYEIQGFFALALFIALILAVLAVKFDKIFTVIGSALFVFAMVCLLLSFTRGMDSLSFVIAFFIGFIIGVIVYKLQFYIVVIITAFTGALIYSLGTSPTFASLFDSSLENSRFSEILLVQLIIFTIAGSVFQVNYWKHKFTEGNVSKDGGERFRNGMIRIPKINYQRYLREIAANWKYFILPVIVFCVVPIIKTNIPYFYNTEYTYNSIFVIELVLQGFYVYGLIQISKNYSTFFGVLNILPFWFLFFYKIEDYLYKMERMDNSFPVVFFLIGYLILLICFKIIYKYVLDLKKALLLIIIVSCIVESQMLDYFNIGIYYGLRINDYLCCIIFIIPVICGAYYFYFKSKEEKFEKNNFRKVIILFPIIILIFVLIGECYVAKVYLLPDIMEKINKDKEIKKMEKQYENEEFNGYSGEVGEFTHYLNGTWIDDNGNKLIYDEKTGHLTLESNVDYISSADYEYYRLEFNESNDTYNEEFFYEDIGEEGADIEGYHYWWISIKGEELFYEIECD